MSPAATYKLIHGIAIYDQVLLYVDRDTGLYAINKTDGKNISVEVHGMNCNGHTCIDVIDGM